MVGARVATARANGVLIFRSVRELDLGSMASYSVGKLELPARLRTKVVWGVHFVIKRSATSPALGLLGALPTMH